MRSKAQRFAVISLGVLALAVCAAYAYIASRPTESYDGPEILLFQGENFQGPFLRTSGGTCPTCRGTRRNGTGWGGRHR